MKVFGRCPSRRGWSGYAPPGYFGAEDQGLRSPACGNASQTEGKLKQGEGSLWFAPPRLPLKVRPPWGGGRGEGVLLAARLPG